MFDFCFVSTANTLVACRICVETRSANDDFLRLPFSAFLEEHYRACFPSPGITCDVTIETSCAPYMAIYPADATPPCNSRILCCFGCTDKMALATPTRAREGPITNGKKRVHNKHLTHKTVFMKDDDDEEGNDDYLQNSPSNSPSTSKRRKVDGLAFIPLSLKRKNGHVKSSKESLLEQRRHLPIWKGRFLLYIA